jgi:predicted small lipoprotein YifL
MNEQVISVASGVAVTRGLRLHPRRLPASGLPTTSLRFAAVACLLSLLGACGQKGELTLPSRANAPLGAASAASAPDTPWHMDPRRVP